MSKYSAFADFLRRQAGSEVGLTFKKIEEVIDAKLPPSARYSAWWSNNPTNNVMTKLWLEAGFKSEQVDTVGRKVTFRRVRHSAVRSDHTSPSARVGDKPFHPLFGALKGMVKVAPGVDLSEPADPDWAKVYD